MKDILLSSYDYNLPEELIAKYPLTKRDEARLLVYDRKKDKIIHTKFKNLLEFIDGNFIFNDTKVIKARIFGNKLTGGKIELLLNKEVKNGYSVYIKGKVKIGTRLVFENELEAEVIELLDDGSRIVKFYHKDREIDFSKLILILEKIGHIPLPPYIKREDTKLDEDEYQTLFAKKEGAVAAPTASLHFSEELLQLIRNKYYITLHVGAGTFKSVEKEKITEHKMHSEIFNIPNKTKEIIDSDEKIIAVGTTVTRTIEYYIRTKKTEGECDLFLNPLNPPKRVDHLITNFHLPKSTLIMLVSSFIGREKTLELYKEAIDNKYRFFSYGDAMLII